MPAAPSEILIRAGSIPDDVDLCTRLWVRAVEARDGVVDAPAVADRVRSAFGHPVVRFAVATAPRSGFALTESGCDEPARALLHFLAVHPEGSGRGVGTALLADAVRHARAGGFTSLVLEARANNARAIDLYTRMGFVPFGEEVPHPLGGHPMQPFLLALA